MTNQLDLPAFNIKYARQSIEDARSLRHLGQHATSIECLNRAGYFRKWAGIEMKRKRKVQ